MANDCLVTKLKGSVNAELPMLGILKFHLPDDAPNGTYRSNILNTVTCHIETTGGFTDGTTSYDQPANQNPNLYFNKPAAGNENIITVNNIYTIKWLDLREAFCMGIKGDSNLNSVMQFGNLKGIMFSCADTNNKSAKPDFYKGSKFVAIDYDGPYYDIKEGDLIKNNPNLKFLRIHSATFTDKLMLTPECVNLTLTSDWRYWNGNIEYFPSSVTYTFFDTANMWGSADALVERIRVSRPSGSIYMKWLRLSDRITIGGVSARTYCNNKGILGYDNYLVWDATSIDIVEEKPAGYDSQPTYSIFSEEVQAAIRA